MRCRECPGCVGRGCQIIGKHTFRPTHGQCQSLQEFSGASYCKTILSWTGTFFSSCQLETCEMLSILVFVLLGNGQVLERSREQALAGTHPEFSRVTLNPAALWRERRHGGICSRKKEAMSSREHTQDSQFILAPALRSARESSSWCCPRGPKKEQLIWLVRCRSCL